MLTKEQIKPVILALVEEKLDFAKTNFNEAQDSVLNETKSTAGDKHETGRAMAQLEVEKAAIRLKEAEQQLHFTRQLSERKMNVAALGALIVTEDIFFYLSLSIGKIFIENQEIICLSPESPLGRSLLGKKSGDSFIFTEKNYTIKEIQ